MWCYWSILLSTCRKVSVVMLMSDTLTKERQQRLLSCIFAPFLYQIIFGTGVSWKRPGVWNYYRINSYQYVFNFTWAVLSKNFHCYQVEIWTVKKGSLCIFWYIVDTLLTQLHFCISSTEGVNKKPIRYCFLSWPLQY